MYPHRQSPELSTLLVAASAFALGAALMYIFDPQQGRRRRALVRDQFVHAGHQIGDAASGVAQDLSNRAYGLYAETRGLARRAAGQGRKEGQDDLRADQTAPY